MLVILPQHSITYLTVAQHLIHILPFDEAASAAATATA